MEFIVAVARNDIDKARSLIQSGADVNKSFVWNSKDTYSPVIPNDMLNRANILNMDQEYQCKPLNIAVLGGHANMVRLLLSAGADINNKDGRGRTAIVCAIYGLDLDASNINTSNLHLISQTNSTHYDIMKNILLCHPNLYYATLDSPQYEIKGITPLCLASYLGKTEIIQLLLEDGRVNVDGTDSKNATALMYAARDGNVPIVKALLGYHASPDITDSHGWSAIQYAERCPEIVQMCEEVLRIKRSELVTSFTCNYSINYSKLSHLLTTIPDYPSSLSHLQFDTIKDINHLDPSATPLIQIIQAAFLQAIKIHDHLSLQTLLMPQSNGPILINYHDPKTGLTALHHAMRTKPLPSIETITLLFQAGADMNAQTYYGRTALHHLARFGFDGQSWGIQKHNAPPRKDTPLVPGVDVPTHLAMCASLLIRFGALVNIADPTGNTPLHFAAEFGGVPEVLEVLVLEGGADLGLKNKKELTPLDVCKSPEIKKKLKTLETQRTHKSMVSSLSGTIRPFDSASEYNHKVSTIASMFLVQEIPKQMLLSTLHRTKDDPTYQEYTDFDIVLKAFFGYQTTFTSSIESSLAFITDSILGSARSLQKLDSTMSQLRLDLREAHDMFDTTHQLVEKVMVSFREELEQVEQIHQTDWEMSELQHDKVEKLFDVFERIDGRFCQLELAQDDSISQLEGLRKAATRTVQHEQAEEDVNSCATQLVQSLLIVQTVPLDNAMYLRDDRNRLYHDLEQVVQKVANLDITKEVKACIEEQWLYVKQILTKPPPASEEEQAEPMSESFNSNPIKRKKQYTEEQNALNELELSFDILHSNLYEIKKDIDEVTDHLDKLMQSKKKMYDLCLSLERELAAPKSRTAEEIQSELHQLLSFTQQLFDKQESLQKERNQLIEEYNRVEKQLDMTRQSLQQVRPPALLQGLLDRLEIDETPCVRIEKDWKEDHHLVNEVMTEITDETTTISTQHEQLSTLQLQQLSTQCTSPLANLCYITRLDTSLYCLKVLSSHLISQSRQNLLQVQASLGQASTELDEIRNQMTQLYDEAAEVARQVLTLKTELETIVRHRKEEVIKVWEVVDEVSKGVQAKMEQNKQQPVPQDQRLEQQQKERVEEQDRHQWIVRELEQLKHVYENLQEAIDALKNEQGMIGQTLRQLASSFIEPQVDKLVGHDDKSLLSFSDYLAELMERIRESDFGLRPVSISALLNSIAGQQKESHQQQQPEQQRTKTNKPSSRTSKHTSGNRLSRISAATQRLSISTYGSNRSSSYVGSHASILLDHKNKHVSNSIRTDKKRMSVISATSLSSLSSYQQERVMAKAVNLSHALAKVQQQVK